MNGFDAAEAFLVGKTVTTSTGSRNITDVSADHHLGFILDLTRGHVTDVTVSTDELSWTVLKNDLFELAGCGDSRMQRLNYKKAVKRFHTKLRDRVPGVDDLYEKIRTRVRELQDQGVLPTHPTDEQKADWAYGNAVLSNPDVTYEMAEKAVAERGDNYECHCGDCE